MRRKYDNAWNQLPHLVAQGSGHMDGAILLAIMQMVEVTKPNRNK